MTKLFLIATAMLSAATSPVIAREVRPAATATESSQSVDATARTPSALQKYCIIDTPTGSHIRQKTCKTRAEWQRDYNFDPLANN